jgi:two-component system chemotaxis response regulator CheB
LTVTPLDRIHLVADGLYRAKGIDLLLQSLARTAGHRTVAVLLSGMLRDGTEGLSAIKAAGGIALVQSPSEAQYPDMPRNALELDGAVDFVGPAGALADEICRRVSVEQSAPAGSESVSADA